MTMLRKKPPSSDPPPPDLVKMRDMFFEALTPRIGVETAQEMREDFDAHLAAADGAEQAWACMAVKLVKVIDALSANIQAMVGRAAPKPDVPSAVDGFTYFKKD